MTQPPEEKRCPILKDQCTRRECAWWVEFLPDSETPESRFIAATPWLPTCAVNVSARSALAMTVALGTASAHSPEQP